MTKERLEEAKLWMEWVSEQDTPRNHSAEMGCVYSSMAMLIAEVERLQEIEAKERERCAVVSENYRSACGHACWHAIAAEIRKPPC